MPRGGARNRSGPQPDEKSLTSAARGLVLTALPPAGYQGEVPVFPLPRPKARERAVWEEVWRTPQACAWAAQPWRHRTVAMWVRWSVRMEATDAPAALGGVVVRLADQIGLTPAGLKENGWKIAPAEETKPAARRTTAQRRSSSRSRLRVVAGGGA
jgi:hypothetical protein